MLRIFGALGLSLALSGCFVTVDSDHDDDDHDTHYVEKAPQPPTFLKAPGTEDMDLPFSAAVRSGDTLYLSGMLGIVPGSRQLAEGGIQPETLQTMQNISRTLTDFGYSMDDVVKCTVFLADMGEWSAMNEVYKTFFRNPPARSAVAVSGLALDARIEVECIADAG